MDNKSIFLFIGKIFILTLVMFILFSVGGAIFNIQSDMSQIIANKTNAAEEQAMTALVLLIICLLDVLILSHLILRSRLRGVFLFLLVSLIYYGIKTLMTQIESWYFMPNITPDMLLKLFLMTVPVALLFPPIAVYILGKFKKEQLYQSDQNTLLLMPIKEWIWKIVFLVGLVYPLLYFGFGYFIAWRNPEVRGFYGGGDYSNFIAFWINLFSENTLLYFFQVLRGLLWIGLAIFVIKFMKAQIWEIALLVALLFSILMNDALLIPNPLMPASVRFTHLLETASSNFIWGWIIVSLLVWHPRYPDLIEKDNTI